MKITRIYEPCLVCGGAGTVTKANANPLAKGGLILGETCVRCLGNGKGLLKEIREEHGPFDNPISTGAAQPFTPSPWIVLNAGAMATIPPPQLLTYLRLW